MYKTLIATGVLAALTGVPALAQDDDFDRRGRDRDNNVEGWYFGGGIGDFSGEIDDPDDVDDLDLDFDIDEDATKLFGGYRFNRFLSVQGDYYDFGESSSALGLLNVTADTKGFAPSVVGTLPLGPVELFARGGILFYDLEISFSTDPDQILDTSNEDPIYAAGIGFTVGERLNIKAEYEIVDIEELNEPEALWLHASWRF
jgi:OOP family OmpA-OmpF porin